MWVSGGYIHDEWGLQTNKHNWWTLGGGIKLLVGGFNPSEKILVSWDDYSKYMEK